MIRFIVTEVAKKSSSQVSTIRYTKKDGKTESERTLGAEWEEIEFTVEQEEEPEIQIANVVGNAVLVGNSKLIVNNPKLFGTYKIGDIIEFSPVTKETVKAN